MYSCFCASGVSEEMGLIPTLGHKLYSPIDHGTTDRIIGSASGSFLHHSPWAVPCFFFFSLKGWFKLYMADSGSFSNSSPDEYLKEIHLSTNTQERYADWEKQRFGIPSWHVSPTSVLEQDSSKGDRLPCSMVHMCWASGKPVSHPRCESALKGFCILPTSPRHNFLLDGLHSNTTHLLLRW